MKKLWLPLILASLFAGCAADTTTSDNCDNGRCDIGSDGGVAWSDASPAEFCEQNDDCPTGSACIVSGETGFAYCTSCEADEFICDEGACIAGSDVCDGQNDCQDGTDESVCDVPSTQCDWKDGHNFRRCTGAENLPAVSGCGWQFCLPNGYWSEQCDPKPEAFSCPNEGDTCQSDATCS